MAEKIINGTTYRAEKLGAREAQRLLLRLGKMFGPSLAQLASVAADDTDGVTNADVERARDNATLSVLGNALQSLDVDEADSLLVELCENAQIKSEDGYERIVFDHHFQGELLDVWMVAAFVIEVNYRDFFGAVARGGVGKAILSSARMN